MKSIVDNFDEIMNQLLDSDHDRICERTGMQWYYLPDITEMFSTSQRAIKELSIRENIKRV